MKSSATAHPIQGLIKYHGLKDEALRLPFHDSISVCTAPLQTHTTFEFGDFAESEVVIDGEAVSGRELERVGAVVEAVMRKSGVTQNFKMHSKNNFPSNVGLGASSSGFAALAVAAVNAAEMELDLQEISKIARLGAGSAARAVTGAFSRWKKGLSDTDSFSVQMASEDLQMGILIALIPAYKSTEDAHKEVRAQRTPTRRFSPLRTSNQGSQRCRRCWTRWNWPSGMATWARYASWLNGTRCSFTG
jgi:phosphomevalonate decarboxylase